jgi:endogenous inhibitor of DNA gyrase (YacG/DUF329 family)
VFDPSLPMHEYACAVCRRTVEYQGALPELYPFCSSRCRLVDFGVWLREGYAIERDLRPDEAVEPDTGPHSDADHP